MLGHGSLEAEWKLLQKSRLCIDIYDCEFAHLADFSMVS